MQFIMNYVQFAQYFCKQKEEKNWIEYHENESEQLYLHSSSTLRVRTKFWFKYLVFKQSWYTNSMLNHSSSKRCSFVVDLLAPFPQQCRKSKRIDFCWWIALGLYTLVLAPRLLADPIVTIWNGAAHNLIRLGLIKIHQNRIYLYSRWRISRIANILVRVYIAEWLNDLYRLRFRLRFRFRIFSAPKCNPLLYLFMYFKCYLHLLVGKWCGW